MRVTYIHQHFRLPQESGGTRSWEFARRLAADGHQVTVIAAGPLAEAWHVEGVRVVRLRVRYDNRMGTARRLVAFAAFMLRATKEAARHRADVVLATSTPLTVAVPGVVAARLRRAAFVLEVRDLWPEVPEALGVLRSRPAVLAARLLERFAYRSAASVVALSPGMAEGVRRVLPSATVTVVPNACDVALFDQPEQERAHTREQLGWGPEEKVLVYAGSFGRTYRVEHLVQVAAELADEPNVRIVLLGEGASLQQCRELAARRGLPVAQTFPGARSKADTARWVAAADGVLSSLMTDPVLHSNSLNKVFDGMAAGRPLFLAHDGWLARLVEEAGAGWRLDQDDPAVAAAQLHALLADPAALARAGEASARLGREHFDRDLLYRELRGVLEDAAAPVARALSRRPAARTQA